METVTDSLEYVDIVNHLNEIYEDVNGSLKREHEPRYKNMV